MLTKAHSKCISCFSLEVTSLQGLSAQKNHCFQKQKLTGQHEKGVHVLLLQTQCRWSDIPVGFTQQLNVGSLVPA